MELLSQDEIESGYESDIIDDDDDVFFQELVKRVFTNRHRYAQLSQEYIAKVAKGEPGVLQETALAISTCLDCHALRPLKAVLAVRFIKDALDSPSRSEPFLLRVKRQLLSKVAIICRQKSTLPGLASSLQTFCLEMILLWSIRFSGQFKSTLKELLSEGVQFLPLVSAFEYLVIPNVDFLGEYTSLRNSLSSLHLVLVSQINHR